MGCWNNSPGKTGICFVSVDMSINGRKRFFFLNRRSHKTKQVPQLILIASSFGSHSCSTCSPSLNRVVRNVCNFAICVVTMKKLTYSVVVTTPSKSCKYFMRSWTIEFERNWRDCPSSLSSVNWWPWIMPTITRNRERKICTVKKYWVVSHGMSVIYVHIVHVFPNTGG